MKPCDRNIKRTLQLISDQIFIKNQVVKAKGMMDKMWLNKAATLKISVKQDAPFNPIKPVLKLKNIFNQIVQGFLKPCIIG